MPDPTPLRLTARSAMQVIRERAQSTANVQLTQHAQERMEERGIIAAEVFEILRSGTVHEPPVRLETGDWQAQVELRMPGGRDAVVVTVIRSGDRLVVRTVMWRDLR